MARTREMEALASRKAAASKKEGNPKEKVDTSQPDLSENSPNISHTDQMNSIMRMMMEMNRQIMREWEKDREEREKDREERATLVAALLQRDKVPLPPDTSTPSLAKLPPINILTFSGDREEWPTFWGLFNDLVHSQHSYPKSMKFHHLRTCLSSDARKLVLHKATTQEGYDNAIVSLQELWR